MSDSKQVTKSKRKVSFTPSQEPIPASVSSQEPPQEDCNSNPLPETPSQAEPASHKGPQDTCQQRTSQSPPLQNPQGNPLSSEYTSPACQANGSGTEDLETPNTNDLSTPARPHGQRARTLSREDRKQAHIKRQLMTNFILGSFDDNSSDEDTAGGLFRQSSRKGSRASLGTLCLETAQAAGETETSTSIIR
ncbi:acetyl-CoA carboxylase 2-like [Cervus canadensis]|nr:acetyl-CoA carboxylase 2-like [Cervus canadensis]XP_043294413.1 acetyl-CoA carboxylase 2-like [Cervus canadensis]XP_043294424.1 acetyl-CoA carboxylase 2-like [Cervus canadensis]XP_043294433.1 acetyl-CoA carboxylase 2-like [Cervus canadensis]